VRAVHVALLACACGRTGFDPIDSVPSLVAVNPIYATTATSSVPATIGAGHLVVVVVDFFSSTFTVSSISDGTANQYVSANARATFQGGAAGDNAGTEIWYAADSLPSSGAVTITLSGDVKHFVWVAEFDHVATTSPLDTVAHTDSSTASSVLSGAALATSTPNEVVVSIGALDSDVTAIASGNPFQALPYQGGDDTAYVVAAEPASYAPVWVLDGSTTYCSSSAAFVAGP